MSSAVAVPRGGTWAPPASRAARVLLAVAAVGAAYHYSLSELWGSLSYDTPLAYLGLVPPLAAIVCVLRAGPRHGELRLPDRQIDWMIGPLLLAVAGAVALLGPPRVSYQFWTNRLDLLGLPFFVGGVVAILFGSRVLYRLRLPIAALALAWPYPYEVVVNRLLGAAQGLALAAVRLVLPVIGGVRGVGGSVFMLGEGPRRFSVNIAPECAGASGALGFLLVAGAAALVFQGRRRAKLAWLATGVALLLGLNVGRLVLILWVGSRYGQKVAIGWLHPYAGLGLFLAGTALLLWLMPRFGISHVRLGRTTEGDAPGRGPDRGWRKATRPAVATVVAAAVLLGLGNGALARYAPFAGLSAAGAVSSLSAPAPVVGGWSGTPTGDIDWAKPFFGSDSTWRRHSYVPDASGGPRGAGPIFLDVVGSADLGSFSRFGLEKCYRFHGSQVSGSHRVDIGSPAPAQVITYRDSGAGRSWMVVSWVSPVRSATGKRYERVVLLRIMPGGPGAAALGAAALEEQLHFARALLEGAR